jgi:hypothetical protein
VVLRRQSLAVRSYDSHEALTLDSFADAAQLALHPQTGERRAPGICEGLLAGACSCTSHA